MSADPPSPTIAQAPPERVANTAWPMFQRNCRHTGASPYFGPAQLQIMWSREVGGFISSGISIDQSGNIYFGTQDQKLYCMNKDEEVLWSYQTQYPFYGGPPVTAAEGVISAASNAVYALPSNGTLIWTYVRHDLAAIISLPLNLGPDGKLYAVLESTIGLGYFLTAIDARTGQAIWQTKVSTSSSAPAI